MRVTVLVIGFSLLCISAANAACHVTVANRSVVVMNVPDANCAEFQMRVDGRKGAHDLFKRAPHTDDLMKSFPRNSR